MAGELRVRRAAIGGAVLLLHFLLLLVLLAAFQPHLLREALGEREIVISLPVTAEAKRPPSDSVPPTFIRPEEAPRPITAPSLEEEAPLKPAAPAQPQGDIGALGRYLYNCSGTYYEKLSAKEKAHCLINKWEGQDGPSLTLGPTKPSPFNSVVAGRNAPAVPIEKPCPTDKPTANLGMPCYDFGGHAPLVEFHH
jgi:hypothetical protein